MMICKYVIEIVVEYIYIFMLMLFDAVDNETTSKNTEDIVHIYRYFLLHCQQ
jgi:hypothetical protein